MAGPGRFQLCDRLTLDGPYGRAKRVICVFQTTIDRGNPAYAMLLGILTDATNTGDCPDIVSNGYNDTTIFQMTDSSFTACDNNGIECCPTRQLAMALLANIHTIAMDIRKSTSSGA